MKPTLQTQLLPTGAQVTALEATLRAFNAVADWLAGEAFARQLANKNDRLGGDEFALLVEDSDDPRDLTEVAEKLLRLFGEPFRLGGKTIELGAAIGISCDPEDGTEPMILLHRTDQAMYRAKALGGCHYRFHGTA